MGVPHHLQVQAEERVPRLLAEALGVREVGPLRHDDSNLGLNFGFSIAGRDFVVDVKVNPTVPRLIEAWQHLGSANGPAIPVVAVLHMTKLAREVALQHSINWIDLSGNAHISATDFLVHIEGRPNQFVSRGRPASLFERRSSRLVRVLLQTPERSWSVSDAAQAASLNPGNVSRLVARMFEGGYLKWTANRRFSVGNPAALLADWREAYDFGAHRTFSGHLAARTGTDVLERLAQALTKAGVRHAATGLAAAWQYDHFAMFRLTSVFLDAWPSSGLLEALGVREQTEGANVWLTVPNDDGVFLGTHEVAGVTCVHPIQAWLDLKAQPERAKDAAQHLRESLLKDWSVR